MINLPSTHIQESTVQVPSILSGGNAVALINNQGDIGKTLQTLGSESSIRNTVAVMVTAGTLQDMGDALGFSQNAAYNGMSGNGSLVNNTSGVATSQLVNELGANLSKNLVNNLTGTLINSAITGQPLSEKSLQNALTSALITAGISQGANSIGEAAKPGPNGEAPAINGFTQAVAHVVLGCAGGAAAAGNSSGCGAGAIGGVVGELTAKFASDANMSPDSAVVLAKVLSATAGLLVSGGDATQVNVAATMGANAVMNNFLTKPQRSTIAEVEKALGCPQNPNQPSCQSLNIQKSTLSATQTLLGREMDWNNPKDVQLFNEQRNQLVSLTADMIRYRENTADTAAWINEQSGRYGAAATAYAAYLRLLPPTPVTLSGSATMSAQVGAANLVSFWASVVEQVARPDPGKLFTEGGVDIALKLVNDRFPMLAPVINEVGNVAKAKLQGQP